MPYKETPSFRENNIEKRKFHFSREPIDISGVNFEHIISIVSIFSFGKEFLNTLLFIITILFHKISVSIKYFILPMSRQYKSGAQTSIFLFQLLMSLQNRG